MRAALASVVGLIAMTAPAFASTGSVYFDAFNDVGAGAGPFFNASTTGPDNVGLGLSVMPNLADACCNVAIGNETLMMETTGSANVATGDAALSSNTKGSANIATGLNALRSNTTGHDDVATGNSALLHNATTRLGTGNYNVATGSSALRSNTIGDDNTALGNLALAGNTTGDYNIGVGDGAGSNLTTGSDNVDIANSGVAGESAVIRIGTKGTQKKAFLAGVSGKSISGTTAPVLINGQGQLGTASAAAKLGREARAGSAIGT
jgi:trimeric autotransporter adhesin